MNVREFFSSVSCYAELNGRVRPKEVVQQLSFLHSATQSSIEGTMASLLHEVWEDEDGVSVFVSDGRPPQLVKDDARLVATFEASSWTEAMTKYYEMYDLGTYKPFASSSEPYSEELRAFQIEQLNASKITGV